MMKEQEEERQMQEMNSGRIETANPLFIEEKLN